MIINLKGAHTFELYVLVRLRVQRTYFAQSISISQG